MRFTLAKHYDSHISLFPGHGTVIRTNPLSTFLVLFYAPSLSPLSFLQHRYGHTKRGDRLEQGGSNT